MARKNTHIHTLYRDINTVKPGHFNSKLRYKKIYIFFVGLSDLFILGILSLKLGFTTHPQTLPQIHSHVALMWGGKK